MFDKLTSAFQKVFRDIRGYGKLSEANIAEALREVRLALLEADVHFQVVKDFVARVREKSVGLEVADSVSPGQQFIKCVNDEMVALLGGQQKTLDLGGQPATILMLGLHGSGKTTTSGKLAARFTAEGRRTTLVACDIRRPAAVDQLRILAGQAKADFIGPHPGETVPALGKRAMEEARLKGASVVLFDTGGRFQIDADLVQELKDLQQAVQARNVVLVLDAAIGQESVHVAETFHKEVGLTGLILTKLDGDARGGAALSVRSVTGCPVLMVGTGEKQGDLEPFYPDRMASRILGMGDVVSLVEKAQEAMDIKDMQEAEEQLLSDRMDFDSFLKQLRMFKKLGPLENLLDMLPGGARVPSHVRGSLAQTSTQDMKRAEAIILSMTSEERRKPGVINASRKRRIAAGSGTRVQDVNELLRRFEMAQGMAKNIKQVQKKMTKFGRWRR